MPRRSALWVSQPGLYICAIAALALVSFAPTPFVSAANAFGALRLEACTEATTEDARTHFCYLYASYSACSFARTPEIANRCARATILAAPGMIAQGKAEFLINIIASKAPTDPRLVAELQEVAGDVHLALDDPYFALFYYDEAQKSYGAAAPARLAGKIAKAQALIDTH